jgi:hypothetical protein
MTQLKALTTSFKGRVLFNSLARPYISVKLAPREKPEQLIRNVIQIMHDSGKSE